MTSVPRIKFNDDVHVFYPQVILIYIFYPQVILIYIFFICSLICSLIFTNLSILVSKHGQHLLRKKTNKQYLF